MVGDAAVRFVGAFADASHSKIARAARLDSSLHGVHVYVVQAPPKIVIRLASEGRGRFVQKVITTISDASKRQFSGKNPAIIWLHVDYVTPEIFNFFAYSDKGPSLFDLIAIAVFDSPKRGHVTQLIFSGGAQLVEKDDGYITSSFRQVVYNSPNNKFRAEMLFPGGRNLVKRDKPMRGPLAKALLSNAIVKVTVASGQRGAPAAP